ncbi:hypothetical protein CDV55_103493 [Aspergillus turcosus]|nr:hypothetical protein CDV55_103493 [Aspergillus turcosus]
MLGNAYNLALILKWYIAFFDLDNNLTPVMFLDFTAALVAARSLISLLLVLTVARRSGSIPKPDKGVLRKCRLPDAVDEDTTTSKLSWPVDKKRWSDIAYLETVLKELNKFRGLVTNRLSELKPIAVDSDSDFWGKEPLPAGGAKLDNDAEREDSLAKGKDNQETIGIRYDYDDGVTPDDGVYHKFQIQPNAGKIPSTFKTWRDKNGGTHKVMATAFVKTDFTKDDVKLLQHLQSLVPPAVK